MDRLRIVLGLLGGAIIAASSVVHSLMGWPVMRAGLDTVAAPPDLVAGLRVGWQFAGLAILVFGIITIALFAERLRGRLVPLLPVMIIAVAYTAFGVWALVSSDMNPFFLIFVVPGLMLLLAAWGPSDRPTPAADATMRPDAALR